MSIKVHSSHQRAFTLIDTAVGIAVTAILLGCLLGFSVYASKSFAALSNYVELEQKSQNALDTMTREIRQAKSLSSYETSTLDGKTITNKLTFLDSDDKQLVFAYQNGVLNKIKEGKTTMLLTNCDFLTFQIFQRNPMGGSYDVYPTANAVNCKLINVSWVCSRSILGSRLNTESVQTAKIVVRNQ